MRVCVLKSMSVEECELVQRAAEEAEGKSNALQLFVVHFSRTKSPLGRYFCALVCVNTDIFENVVIESD